MFSLFLISFQIHSTNSFSPLSSSPTLLSFLLSFNLSILHIIFLSIPSFPYFPISSTYFPLVAFFSSTLFIFLFIYSLVTSYPINPTFPQTVLLTPPFSAEIKVIAQGFLLGNDCYLRSGWNIMDGSLVAISLIDILVTITANSSPRIFGILRVFRLLRTLRPLRFALVD